MTNKEKRMCGLRLFKEDWDELKARAAASDRTIGGEFHRILELAKQAEKNEEEAQRLKRQAS